MDAVELLHNAARHYCNERHELWGKRYDVLVSSGRHQITRRDGSWTYTPAAYDIFPRYHVLAAIRSEAERFVPSDFASLDELRSMLAMVGEAAGSALTRFNDPVALQAAKEERRLFIEFVQTAEEQQIAHLPRCPFRRALGLDEHARLHQLFIERWGQWYGGEVAPATQPSAEVVTLHEVAMERGDGYIYLQEALRDHGVTRVFELREYGDGFEVDATNVDFTYNGAEGFWMDAADDPSWMVYASHESSISFGGTWLIESMKRMLPEFERFRYRGWDLNAYRDG